MQVGAQVGARVTVALLLVLGTAGPAQAQPETDQRVNLTIRIGQSVQGVPIYAYRRNAINPQRRMVVIGNVHGDEPAGIAVATYLRDHPGGLQRGIELWVIPTLNPDGTRLGTRQNARKVDLNRNFPYQWRYDATPKYYSGPSVASEPETKAMVGFLHRYRPQTEVVFHQPLRCVDTTTSPQALSSLMSQSTGLPLCRLGARHGSQADYAHALTSGSVAMTVEFGYTANATMISNAIAGTRRVANAR